jgi:hypothetical protein
MVITFHKKKATGMLGEMVLESTVKVGVAKVISGSEMRVEVSFEGGAKVRGIEVKRIGTYVTIGRSGGAMLGSAEGLIMTKDGEVAAFKGHGVGRFDREGTQRWRGCMFYETQSTGKLAFLNNLVSVFEHEVFASGESTGKEWEWK